MFILRIDTGNAAMGSTQEMAEALRKVAAELEAFDAEPAEDGSLTISGSAVLDGNGNSVGSWRLIEGEPRPVRGWL